MIELTRIDRFRELPIELLIEADWNYKEQDLSLSRKLVENIRRNGQLENIIVRQLPTGYFEVVNGNHRLVAFRELNFETVIVYDCGEISLVEDSSGSSTSIGMHSNSSRRNAHRTRTGPNGSRSPSVTPHMSCGSSGLKLHGGSAR